MRKKYRLGSLELSTLLIDKELEKYNVTTQDILAKQEISGIPWYQFYTFENEDERNRWKEFCMNILLTEVSPKLNKKTAEKHFAMFDLMYGLKIKHIK